MADRINTHMIGDRTTHYPQIKDKRYTSYGTKGDRWGKPRQGRHSKTHTRATLSAIRKTEKIGIRVVFTRYTRNLTTGLDIYWIAEETHNNGETFVYMVRDWRVVREYLRSVPNTDKKALTRKRINALVRWGAYY